MPHIPKKTISLARRSNLVDLVSAVGVPVRRFRDHVKIPCIFHAERTPSLAIYPDHFMCYGCSETGDAIRWVMETEGVPFDEAIQILLQLQEQGTVTLLDTDDED